MKFSIVIPTYNRGRQLYKTLQSISKCNVGNNLIEVIVVDNSSNTTETAIAQKNVLKIKKIIDVRFFISKKKGPSAARNMGIKKARYKHIIFIDDDVTVPPEFIEKYQQAWNSHSNSKIIGGRVIPRYENKTPVFVHDDFSWVFANFDRGNKAKIIEFPDLLISANLSISLNKKERSSGIFNQFLGARYFFNHYLLITEDAELCHRLQLEGEEIQYEPLIYVYNNVYKNRLTINYYWSRIITVGIGEYVSDWFLKKHTNFFPHQGWIKLRHNFATMIKTLGKPKTKHSFWEGLVYTVAYHVFGRIMILYMRLFYFSSINQFLSRK